MGLGGIGVAIDTASIDMRSLKRCVRDVLKSAHVYERLKVSWFYRLFWTIADREVVNQLQHEIDFYKDTLSGIGSGDLIFDIGANQGYKTGIFLALGARVVAVDPDEFNQATLKERFLTYRILKKPVTIVGKAVSDKIGTETFWIDEPGSGKNTLNEKWVGLLRHDQGRFGKQLDFERKREVATITLEELISTYGVPFFIKIDVEGHEPHVLATLRRPIPYLSFEVNLPEFRAEALQCIELLQHITKEGKFNYWIEGQSKLAEERWLNASEFANVFDTCIENSMEVFWKTRF